MPGSTMSVFGEPSGYEVALRDSGVVGLLVTGRGAFRAQLTRIVLARMSLLAGEETVSRIAFACLPSRLMRISLPGQRGASLFRGEIASRPDEIVSHAPGQRMHERTVGPSRWRTVWLPEKELAEYFRAMTGATFAVPPRARRWRPPPGALRCLTGLYDDAIRANKVRPRLAAVTKVARGLEQQLIEALVECLLIETTDEGEAARLRHLDIMVRFEDLLQAWPDRIFRMPEISAALGVPDRTLRACCEANLGMGGLRYVHLRRMQMAHRALRDADPGVACVSHIARRYGFKGLSRFAADYRLQFGELPSATLHNVAEG